MCDAVTRNSKSWWTIDDGYCLPYPLPFQALQLDATNQTSPCDFVLKCALSNSLDQNCNCQNPTECGQLVKNICKDAYLFYPASNSLIYPYSHLLYARGRDWTKKKPDLIALVGQIKCTGYQFIINRVQFYSVRENFPFYMYYEVEYIICNMAYSTNKTGGLQNLYPIEDHFSILFFRSNDSGQSKLYRSTL
jgi:hypothetical protein